MAAPSSISTVAFVLLLLAAPSIPGIIVKTKAILTGRRGAPVWQLYADLAKLAQRGTVYSTTTTWMFRLAPVVLVATTVAAATLLPLNGHRSLLRFSGDAVAFVYLLALGRFTLVLAALDTGSSFEGMGASREVAFASMVEPGLFIAFAALAVMAHDLSLSAMLTDQSARTAGTVIVAISLFALALAECSRIPVDDPATHLELTMIHEVMVLDHSGPDLAMILYANALKLAAFATIIMSLLLPTPDAESWTGLAAVPVGLVAVGVAIGVVESAVARLRLPKAPLYIAGGSALALFGLILLLR